MSKKEIIRIPIEKGIPIPPSLRFMYRYKFPFSDMEIGDSFKIEYDRGGQQSIYSAIKVFKKNHEYKDYQFVIRADKNNGTIRVWRIE